MSGLLATVLIGRLIVRNVNGLESQINGCGIVWQATKPLQISLVNEFSYSKSEPRLMMARFSRELIINTSEEDNKTISLEKIPQSFAETRISRRRIAFIMSGLIYKHSLFRTAIFDWPARIIIVNVIF